MDSQSNPDNLGQEEKSSENNDGNYYVVTICLYILFSFLLIGTIFNMIFSIKSGEFIKIKIKNRIPFLYYIIMIFVWLSIILFPFFTFYLFTEYYVLKKKTLIPK